MKNISFRSRTYKGMNPPRQEGRRKIDKNFITEVHITETISQTSNTYTHTHTHTIFHSNLQSTFIKLTFRSKFDGTRARNPNSHRAGEKSKRGREGEEKRVSNFSNDEQLGRKSSRIVPRNDTVALII